MMIIGLVIGVIVGIFLGCTNHMRLLGLLLWVLALAFNNQIFSLLSEEWMAVFYDSLSGGFGVAYLLGLLCSVADYYDSKMSSEKRAKVHIFMVIIRTLLK